MLKLFRARMHNTKNGYTGGLYYRLWGSLFFLAIVVLILTMLLFYWQFSNILLGKLQEADTEVLRQNESSFRVSKQIAYSITNRIFMDNSTAWLLYGRQYDPIRLSIAIQQLNNYRASLPYIESIYVYNGSARTITVNSANNGTYTYFEDHYTNNSFFDPEALEILENIDRVYKRNVPIPRKVAMNTYGRTGEEQFLYTFICTDSFLPYPSGAVVLVNFSYDWMRQVAALGDGSEALATLVLDGNGKVVSDNAVYPAGTDMSQEKFYARMQEDSSESGRFREVINGSDMVVTYIAPDENGWRHVRITPYQNVVRELNRLLSVAVGITAALFALVMVTSYISSRVLYKPIGKMGENLAELEEEYRLSSTTSRQHVLRDILFGIESNTSAMRRYMWELKIPREEAHYRVLLLKIDDYNTFINKNDVPGQGLLRYAMINIAVELCGSRFPTEGVDTGEENGVALIIAMEPDETGDWSAPEKWEEFLEPVAQSVEKFLGHSVGFIVGDVCVSLSDLPDSYRRAKDAAFRRMFYKDNLVLMAEYHRDDQMEQDVSNTRRSDVAEAMASGDAQRAKAVVREIIFEVEHGSYTVVRLVVGRLILLLDNIASELHKGQPAAVPDDLSELLRWAGHLNEKTLGYFDEAIDKIVESAGGQYSVRHTGLIQRINQIIEERYFEPDCSVVTIAQEVGMSTTYIGRIYKHYSFKTISETISVARMEQARRLLREHRRMSVEQVAQQSGFSSSSYFAKAFRKENGMTPNEYRHGASLDKRPEETV